MIRFKYLNLIAIFTISIMLMACGGSSSKDGGTADNGKKEYQDRVLIHNLSDAQGLHPHNTSDATSTEVKRYMYQKLLEIDHKTLKLIPILAKGLPIIEEVGDKEGMLITYELREEAKWDDGTPITAADVEFSFKTAKNPKVDAGHLRPYIEFITDFKTYPDNPRKFTFICDKVYMLADHVTGNDIWIIPKHKYDPTGIMDQYTISDFASKDESIANKQSNIDFARAFNDSKFQREEMHGSGPYKLESWITDQRMTFVKKDNWWGNDVKDGNMYFENNQNKIVYQTINDWTAAITSLKSEKLDLIGYITKPKDWLDLDDSDKFKANFKKYSPPFMTYSYIGMHMKDPKLTDKKVRLAINHIVDVDKINETILYGMSKRIVGNIIPSMGDAYNHDIKPYQYNLDKAKQLLADAGWSDSNNNGILDKVIDGKQTELSLTYGFNQGNDVRKQIGLILKEEARKAGINVDVQSFEWSVYLEKLKAHDGIDVFYSAWVMDPRPSDPKQIWGTESYNGGSNYCGFGNAETDELIEQIRAELNEDKRNELYHQWQQILHEEVPCVFLYTQDRRMVVHKRFENLNDGARDPGFWAPGFTIASGFSNFAN